MRERERLEATTRGEFIAELTDMALLDRLPADKKEHAFCPKR